MLIYIIKSTFATIVISLIFCPMQIFAADGAKNLETLHSRPKQIESLELEKSQGIILNQSETPIIVDPVLIEPQIPLINDPTINTPEDSEIIIPEVTAPEVTTPEVTAPEVTTPEVIAPEIIKPEVAKPKSEEDKESNKENNLTNILDFMKNEPQNQDKQLSDELKDKPSQIIVPMSLTDFLIQTTKDELLDDKDKEITPEKIVPKEKSPTKEEIVPKEDIPTKEKTVPKEDIPVKEEIVPKENISAKEEKVNEEKVNKENSKEEINKVEKKKGEPLKIPEEAKQTGNLDFLEGCWVGNRPEYNTKRIITERFCFNDKGIGKRYIIDPQYAGACIGSTKALVNKDGLLHMNSEKMYCSPSGEQWGASEMQCQGEGEQTPCNWIFKDINGATQAYTINFVRE